MTPRRDRFRVSGRVRPAWLPTAQRPDKAMRRPHLGDRLPDPARVRTDSVG
jgi:hypothetical protein